MYRFAGLNKQFDHYRVGGNVTALPVTMYWYLHMGICILVCTAYAQIYCAAEIWNLQLAALRSRSRATSNLQLSTAKHVTCRQTS